MKFYGRPPDVDVIEVSRALRVVRRRSLRRTSKAVDATPTVAVVDVDMLEKRVIRVVIQRPKKAN